MSNVIRFDSATSAFRDFTITQEPSVFEIAHDHMPAEVTGDGSESTVCRGAEMRGPYKFLGDAMAEMKRWAAESDPVVTTEPEQPAE